MVRLESVEDEMNDVVTYELRDGRRVCLAASAVRECGAAAILRAMRLAELLPTERGAVMHHGRQVGTVPPDFDPLAIKSLSFLYDPRRGDFRREGDVWVAAHNLGAGDFECIPGFQRSGSSTDRSWPATDRDPIQPISRARASIDQAK